MVLLGKRTIVWGFFSALLRFKKILTYFFPHVADITELWLQDPVCANHKIAVKLEGARNTNQAWFQG
jgi:hypothetical protein